MNQASSPNGATIHDLESNSQISAAGRFWQLCMAMEMSAQPKLRPTPSAPTFLEDRRVLALVGCAAQRVVRLVFGVVLRDITRRPEVFSQAMAVLANSMAYEIGDNLSSFPLDERVRAFEGLSAKLAEGLQIGLAVAGDEVEGLK